MTDVLKKPAHNRDAADIAVDNPKHVTQKRPKARRST